MKRAIVTGASSGIGEAIANMLLLEGFEVYGLARRFDDSNDSPVKNDSPDGAEAETFEESKIPNEHYHRLCIDITRTHELEKAVKGILKEGSIDLLVNNAGVGHFGPHEEISPHKLHEMVALNLEAPLILTQMLLRSMKQSQGTIVNISSVTAEKVNTYGCAYGATKAGLASFSASLFEEVRKYGVRVVNIEPDMTKSSFYDDSDFREGDTPDTYLEPEEVAEAVKSVIDARSGLAVTKLVLRPQRHMIIKKEKGWKKNEH